MQALLDTTQQFEQYYLTLEDGTTKKQLWRTMLDARHIQEQCMVALSFPGFLDIYDHLVANKLDPEFYAKWELICRQHATEKATTKEKCLDFFFKKESTGEKPQ